MDDVSVSEILNVGFEKSLWYNGDMKKGKLGFTLVEVSLFLAVSALLFLGVTMGVQSSVRNQRYNDSVQSFTEFLRGVYAGVLNVQNKVDGGKSNREIYGKLVTFGEKTDFAGNTVGEEGGAEKGTVFVYTVVGDANGADNNSVLETLKSRNADVIEVKTEAGGARTVDFVGFQESYIPKWGTEIEKPCSTVGMDCTDADKNVPLDGMLLIVRHPVTGTVYTMFKETETDNQINEKKQRRDEKILSATGFLDGFRAEQIDFCVRPLAEEGERRRTDIRLVKGARNASGIEMISESDPGVGGLGGFRCGW